MAMNKDVLGQAIVDRILTMVPFGIIVPDDTKDSMRTFWTAIADEIINHIAQNAEIDVEVISREYSGGVTLLNTEGQQVSFGSSGIVVTSDGVPVGEPITQAGVGTGAIS